MTLQFRQKSQQGQFQQLEKEVALLRDYNKALQQENQSRNEERKILHAQIDRLLAIEQDWKSIGTSSKDKINITQTVEYIQIYQKYTEVKKQYESLLEDHQLLIEKTQNNYSEINRQSLAKAERQKIALQQIIRNHESKIMNLEAQISRFQREINQFKKDEQGSNMLTKQLFSFQVRIDEFQRQVEIKSKQLSNLQRQAASKEQRLNQEITLKQRKIDQLQRSLRAKDQEVAKVKGSGMTETDSLLKQITQYQFKNSELERQLSLKSGLEQTISRKDEQINRLTQRFNMGVLEKQRRIDELETQLKTKTKEIVKIKGAGITESDELLKQVTQYQFKNSELQRQLQIKSTLEQSISRKDEQIRRLSQYQTKNSQLLSQILLLKNKNQENLRSLKYKQDQISTLELKISELSTTIRIRNDELSTLQKQYISKDEEISSLKIQVSNHQNKVISLQGQLERSIKTRSHIETIKYVESEDTVILRSKLQQMHSSNQSLQNNINGLVQETQNKVNMIKDLERRIAILQDANRNLEHQLRITIENHKVSSRVSQSRSLQEQQLKQIIFSLKEQLYEVRSFSQLVRKENQDLKSQLQHYQTHSRHCRHNVPNRDRSRSRSPQPLPQNYQHSKVIVDNKGTKYSQLTFRQDDEFQRMVKTSPLNSGLYKGSTSTSSLTKDRYEDLQRKIRQLQSENKTLKQHLI